MHLINKQAIANPLVIIGAQKCGTTTLASDLSKVNAFNVDLQRKEDSPLLMDGSENSARKRVERLKVKGKVEHVNVDISTLYSFRPLHVVPADRISKIIPDAKFVYLLRERIGRTLSHYQHDSVLGITKQSAKECVTLESTYVKNSLYGMQVEPWVDHYGSENILLVKFEEYVQNRQKVISEICRFAGVSDEGVDAINSDEMKNVTSDRLKFSGVVASFIRSRLYLVYIKPLMLFRLRQKLKQLFGYAHTQRKPVLEQDTIDQLAAVYEQDQYKLEALFPNSPTW